MLRKQKGFTLIEIVLVIAIAALLLLIVFLALSGAQKARRDSQRRNDAARFVTAVETYASNNQGTLPTAAQVTATYFTGTDPQTGLAYTISNTPATAPAVGAINYASGYICGGAVGTTTGASARNYAVVIGLEQGGSSCIDNK